jgi:hypothetical protein
MYLQQVGGRCKIQALSREVNNGFDTAMDTNAQLTAGEEV